MITTAIIGASGYSGAELLRLLSLRNDVSIEHTFAATSAGKDLDAVYPFFSKQVDLPLETFDSSKVSGIDLAFVALPSGEAMNAVSQLLPVAGRVIDLSGDFRLHSPQLYKEFYRHDHIAPELLSEAVYGLPELNKEAIARSRFVSNPGCYPTSAILGLLPALKYGCIEPKGIVVNSLSGVSGAGRQSSTEYSYTEINENIRAYKIGQHQHLPEIQTVLQDATGKNVSLSFVPHLVPLTRGIYTTIHANLTDIDDEEVIRNIYKDVYSQAPFVRVRNHVPQVKDVLYTNFCDISITVERRTKQLIIISVLDNLVKGAAGQAIQNMNIMFGLPETEGFILNKERQYVHAM